MVALRRAYDAILARHDPKVGEKKSGFEEREVAKKEGGLEKAVNQEERDMEIEREESR